MLAPIKALLETLLAVGEDASVHLTLTEAGIDLLLTLPSRPDLTARETLAAFAESHDLARLSLKAMDDAGEFLDPVSARRDPVLRFGGVPVIPSPGGFLQATAEGEAEMTARVLAAADADVDIGPWSPSFDEADDLDGLLSAQSPLLSRAFRTADRHDG